MDRSNRDTAKIRYSFEIETQGNQKFLFEEIK